MKNPKSDRVLFYFLLRVQQIAQQDRRSEQGYAMVVVSIVTLLIFSLIAMYLTLTSMSTASTSAYVDGTNTFYAAESGLNRRAELLREKFIGYSLPTGLSPGQTVANTFVPPTNIANCFMMTTTNSGSGDFNCQNFTYAHNDTSTATVKRLADKSIQTTNLNQGTNYNAYTFVTDVTNYVPGSNPLAPATRVIPPGQEYAGLNAMEYKYTVYSTAAKQSSVNTVQQADAKTVLQMDFKSRIVPLFQFAVFYDGDLEMNSTSNMTIGGRVHTNSNFYVQPNTNNAAIATTFLSPITVVGSIYNRVDSTAYNTGGITQMLMTGTAGTPSANYLSFPAYDASITTPLSEPQLTAFGNQMKSGAYNAALKRLDTPPPGFLRKRNYYQSGSPVFTSNAGEYYAKADLRLEMVPDRDVTSTAASPWTRNQAIIPFNFTSITTSRTGACSTTLPPTDPSTTGIPTPASDPAANYVAVDRNNVTNLKCHVFTKGQLQSLRQPVMVLTNLNQPNIGLRTSEGTALGIPTLPSVPAGLSSTANLPATQTKILRALQVAIASSPTPIALDTLNTALTSTSLANVQTEFTRLLNTIPTSTLPSADVNILKAATPNQIAAISGAWFLPAPIQRIETGNNPDTTNSRQSGFYDGREQRWITMLQTNIASLSVWNRDGLYVEASDDATDTRRRNAYVTSTTLQDAAFNSGAGANLTDGLAFDRSATIPASAKGLQQFGLGSVDTTEGGLVFHATVSDDLNGDGVMNANDVSLDIANPIMKRDAVGNLIGADNKPVTTSNPAITIDYPRKYRGSASQQSPFGFAFNGGSYLPAPMTLVTDQAIYVQGDFNNNGAAQTQVAPIVAPDANRLPASIIGDTITILSNQCLSMSSTSASTVIDPTTTRYNDLLVPMGQISCGIPNAADGSAGAIDLPGAVASNTANGNGFIYPVTSATAVNAAFLSNTDRSIGNLGNGRGFGSTTPRFSGALNNYIRMLEDWGQAQYFNYSGSFVSLGTPLEYSGRYIGGGTYYMIPVRNFNFDTNFNTFNLLPPLPPRAIYLQQDVFRRNYNY